MVKLLISLVVWAAVCLLSVILLTGCTEIRKELDKLENIPSLEVTPTPTPKPVQVVSLPYMTKDQTTLLLEEISKQMVNLEKADYDMAARFCKNYKSLSLEQRTVVWGYLANAIVQKESGFKNGAINQCTKLMESSGDLSQGWFQLTYGNKFCPANKSKGDLCNVEVNVKCGVQLMGWFVGRDRVVTDGGYIKYGAKPARGLAKYWAVTRMPDTKRKHHLQWIMDQTKKAPGC